jgi:hypothetical protein
LVVPALSLAVPLCDEFPNGGTLTVRDVLAVTRRNVVALCDVQHATTVPAKQLVIKIRMSRDARDSLQHEMACVSVCNDVLEDVSYQPPKLICSLLDSALLFEHVKGVPISECCTCSTEKRAHLLTLLVRDIAPIRAALAAKGLLYVDWHSGNVLVDDPHAPSKLFLVDFESVMPKDGEPPRHSPLRGVRDDWAVVDEENWKLFLKFFS